MLNRFVKLEDEMGARGYSYLNSYKALHMVSPVFVYIITHVSFRKLKNDSEGHNQKEDETVIIDEKQLMDLGMLRAKRKFRYVS